MSTLRDAGTVDAWVVEDATFVEAARALAASGIPAVAVLAAGRRVVGVFTEQDLVAGLSAPSSNAAPLLGRGPEAGMYCRMGH